MTTVIGILGAAGIAPAALLRPALRRGDVVVAAVASRRDARGYADRFGIEWAYDSYEELLADQDLDLVYNALPPSLHARWSMAALSRRSTTTTTRWAAGSGVSWPGGGLGRVRRAEAIFTGATPFDPGSIRHDPALGGGALMDLGCYPIHWLRTALGAEPEVRRARRG